MSPPLSRRRLLALAGATGTTAVAGCLDSWTGSDGDGGGCAPGYREVEALDGYAVVDSLRFASLSLPATVQTGGTFTATLANEADAPLSTRGRTRYAVQRLGDDGTWRTTVGVPADYDWPTAEQVLAPGETLEWSVTLRRGEFPEPFERCTTHTPGTYRFLYWGFGAGGRGGDDGGRDAAETGVALAAPFSVVE